MIQKIYIRFQPEALKYQRPGDLIFSRGKGLISALSRWGQSAKDNLPADFSHVAVCVYPGLFVHSVPRGGVRIFRFEEPHGIKFQHVSPPSFAALRFDAVGLDVDEVIYTIGYWTGQRYNFKFFQTVASKGSVFCSQLVIQILEAMDIHLPGVQSGAPITPSELMRIASANGARDVSNGYVDYSQRLREDRKERDRLRYDIVRGEIQKAIQRRLSLAAAESYMNKAAAGLNLRSLKSIMVSKQTIGTFGPVTPDGLLSECNGIAFVLSYCARMLTVGPDFLPAVRPKHWLEENYTIDRTIVGTTIMIEIAHLRRLRDMVIMLVDERAGMEVALAHILHSSDRNEAEAMNVMKRIAGRLAGFPDFPLLPIHEQLRNMPTPQDHLLEREDIATLHREVEVLREGWRQLVAGDLRVRKALVAVSDLFIPSAS